MKPCETQKHKNNDGRDRGVVIVLVLIAAMSFCSNPIPERLGLFEGQMNILTHGDACP